METSKSSFGNQLFAFIASICCYQEGRQFENLSNSELSYRQMQVDGTIVEKWSRLQEVLEAEAIYKLMIRLVFTTDEASAFCAVEDTIPCIMHGGN
jgi:hypothetical protein